LANDTSKVITKAWFSMKNYLVYRYMFKGQTPVFYIVHHKMFTDQSWKVFFRIIVYLCCSHHIVYPTFGSFDQ